MTSRAIVLVTSRGKRGTYYYTVHAHSFSSHWAPDRAHWKIADLSLQSWIILCIVGLGKSAMETLCSHCLYPLATKSPPCSLLSPPYGFKKPQQKDFCSNMTVQAASGFNMLHPAQSRNACCKSVGADAVGCFTFEYHLETEDRYLRTYNMKDAWRQALNWLGDEGEKKLKAAATLLLVAHLGGNSHMRNNVHCKCKKLKTREIWNYFSGLIEWISTMWPVSFFFLLPCTLFPETSFDPVSQ